MTRRGRLTLLASLALGCCTAGTDAHLVTTGFGPFYDGVAHLAASPDDVLVVVAVAFLAGLAGVRFGRGVMFVLPGAWLIGGLCGSWVAGTREPQVWSAVSLLVVVLCSLRTGD